MGHRALVAVERADGRYDLYHARWGADDRRLRTVLDAGAGTVGYLLDSLGGVDPLASGATAGGVFDHLDPLTHEALLVFEEDPTVYLVVTVRVETADGRPEPPATRETVLVPVADVETAARIRRFARTVSGVLGDAGLVSPAMARGYLRARLATHPDVSPDSLWLGGDRTGGGR